MKMAFEEQKRFTECKSLQEENDRLKKIGAQLKREKETLDNQLRQQANPSWKEEIT
jgi:hypothetical protein